VVDVDGSLTSDCYREVFNSGVKEEHFELFDSKDNQFFVTAESLIYGAAQRLFDRYGNPCTVDTISEEILKNDCGLQSNEKKAVIEALRDIEEYEANSNETRYLIDLVLTEYKDARLNQVFQTAIKLKENNLEKSINYSIKTLAELKHLGKDKTSDPDTLSLQEASTTLLQKIENKESIVDFACHYGILEVDQRLDGIRRREYVVICGPSSSGKSFISQEFAYQAALTQNKRVIIASTEMNTEDILLRLMSRQTKIPSRKLQRPETLTEEELERYKLCAKFFQEDEFNDRLIFVQKGKFSNIEQLKQIILQRLGDKQLDLLVLDYIENLTASTRGMSVSWEQNKAVSQEFAHLIDELNCGGITPAQNNAKGMVNGGDGAGIGEISFKQLYKDSNTFLMVSEDQTIAPVPPVTFDLQGTPGIIYLNVIKARGGPKNGPLIGLNAEFSTASISAASLFKQVAEPEKRRERMERRKKDTQYD
jgi:replicative DNA helicase